MLRFEPLGEPHRNGVIDIFNYYVENTNYAYPKSKLGYEAFDLFLANAKQVCGYAVLPEAGELIGFCQLKPYSPHKTFEKTVEISYFLEESSTGKGLGKEILGKMVDDARRMGKRHILASISGDNEASLAFHRRHGFIECGRLKGVGCKLGKDFDIVYMQMDL